MVKDIYKLLEEKSSSHSTKQFREGYKIGTGYNKSDILRSSKRLFAKPEGGSYENIDSLTHAAKQGDNYARGVVAGLAEKNVSYGDYRYALGLYLNAGILSEAKIRRLAVKLGASKQPSNKEVIERLMAEVEKRKENSLDKVVASIMAIAGIGVLYMLFSKQQAGIASSQLLAPPFQNYWIYVFPVIFIAGAIYFLWKKAHRDLIPLSFR